MNGGWTIDHGRWTIVYKWLYCVLMEALKLTVIEPGGFQQK